MFQLLLPYQYGGLGLYLREDFEEISSQIPRITMKLLYCRLFLASKYPKEISEAIRIIRMFPSNDVARGMDLKGTFDEVVRIWIESLLDKYVHVYQYGELMDLPSIKALESKDMETLRNLGYIPLADVVKMAERSFVFTEILKGNVTSKVYNTTRWERRWSNTWRRLAGILSVIEDQWSPLDAEGIQKALGRQADFRFVNLDQKIVLPDPSFDAPFETTLRAELEWGSPTLQIPKEFVRI